MAVDDEKPKLGQNPGDSHYDDEFNRLVSTPGMQDSESARNYTQSQENTSGLYDQNGADDREKGIVDDNEQIPYDNSTKKTTRNSGFLGKITGLLNSNGLKAGGVTAILLSLIGLSYFSSMSFPAAMLGNMNNKSDLLSLQGYFDDYLGFRVFGNNKTGSVSTTTNQIKGLRDTEVAELRSRGVEFQPSNGRVAEGGKKTFDSVRYKNGPWVSAGDDFLEEMVKNPEFRRAMLFNKGSYWKSFKSKAWSSVRSLFRFSSNPKIVADKPEETNKNMIKNATEGVDGDISTEGPRGDVEETDAQKSVRSKAEEVAGDAMKEVETQKKAIDSGEIPAELAEKANGGNVSAQMAGEAVDVDDMTKGVPSKVWGFINALAPLDALCTIYQTAHMVNMISRTIALANMVRLAMTFVVISEKVLAGDDDGGLQYMMSVLQKNDPATGQTFSDSVYAGYLFNGVLLAEPLAATAVGGAVAVAMSASMRSLHSTIGKTFSLGLAASDANFGRQFLKNTCGLVQNLGVQLSATAASIALAVVSGGASGAAQAAGSVGIKQSIQVGLQVFRKEIVQKFSKEAIKASLDKVKTQVAKEGLLKTVAKNSWNTFKTVNRNLSGWDKLGMVVAGVSVFGMPFMISALSGGDIAGFLGNGFAAFDAIGTGYENATFANAVVSGGTVGTYSQVAAMNPSIKTYQNTYVAEKKLEARSNPLNIKNHYSTFGSLVFNAQKTLGISNSLNLRSSALSIAKLPLTLLGKTAYANKTEGEDLTPEAIGRAIDDPYFNENKIATTVTGSPRVLFKKHYSFEDVVSQLIDGQNPQMKFDGNDPETGEPSLSIIDGSDLAQYAEKCHNPDRLELDPMYTTGDGDEGIYDINTCVEGGSNYNKDKYPLYADAIRYMYQASPSDKSDSAENANNSDSPNTDSGGPIQTSLPSGTSQELAKQIVPLLGKEVICTGYTNGCQDIKNNAEGKSAKQVSSTAGGVRGCAVDSIDPRILGLIINLVKEGHRFTISSLCWGRGATKDGDNHVMGRGIDFSIINGQVVSGRSWSEADKLLNSVTKFMPPSGSLWFGQYTCSSRTNIFQQIKSKGYRGGYDSCDHQHISVYNR